MITAIACGKGQESTGSSRSLSFGVLTDVHYADKEEAIGRFYRDSTAKVRQAIETFNRRNLSFCVQLGDLVDDANSDEIILVWLKTILKELSRFEGTFHFVLGNHDLSGLSKAEFLSTCQTNASHYAFDSGLFHFIVLDACFNADGSDYNAGNFTWTETYISAEELEWLREYLKSGTQPAILFTHQRLDDDDGPHGIGNAPAVREILEASGRVLAVFQGHDHAGGYSRINGIDYFTMRALVQGAGIENNSYAIVHIESDGSIAVEGFGGQKAWPGSYAER